MANMTLDYNYLYLCVYDSIQIGWKHYIRPKWYS